MNSLDAYTTALTSLIPFISALGCGLLVGFSLSDCVKREEKKLKKVILFYLFISGLGWFVTFSYEFFPALFVWLNVACLFTFVSASIFFYRIVRFLTRLGLEENFSVLHYVLPVALVVVMLVWSMQVPFDVQLEIVTSKARVIPEGYRAFTLFFTSKPLLRVAFGLVYYILAIRVLMKYYKRASGNRVIVRQPMSWLLFLVGISIASLFSSVLPTLMPRGEILHSVWTLIVALSIAAQHLLLSYHIICRDYYPYIITEEMQKAENRIKRVHLPDGQMIEVPFRQHKGMMKRVHFEKYIQKERPYLKPDYRISDMVEALDVNRTELSKFINSTYGVNFNRYINRLRLKEIERLRALPENENKPLAKLVAGAGFGTYRSYRRARIAEENEEEPCEISNEKEERSIEE